MSVDPATTTVARRRHRLVPAPVRPHPALHARRASRRRRVAATAGASCSCAAAAAPTRSTACGSSTPPPARSASSPIPQRPARRGDDDDDLPPEERARRERAREAAGGITAFATDADVTVAAFALAGRLFVAGLIARHGPRAGRRRAGVRSASRPARPARRLRQRPPAVRRRARRSLARARRRRARRARDGHLGQRRLRRRRGDGPLPRLLVEPRRHGARRRPGRHGRRCSAGTSPTRPTPRPHPTELPLPGRRHGQRRRHAARRRPRRLGRRRRVGPRRASRTSPTCSWTDARSDRRPSSRATSGGVEVARRRPGHRRDDRAARRRPTTTRGSSSSRACPASLPDGALVTCADRDGARRLLVDGEPVTPPDLQVRAVATVDGPGIVFIANPIDDATSPTCGAGRADGALEALTDEPGVHAVAAGGGTVVVRTATLDEPAAQWDDARRRRAARRTRRRPSCAPTSRCRSLGERALATAVLLPRRPRRLAAAGAARPVRRPARARASCASHNAHLTSQWFADQGFAVVVADGRGTPGAGSAWERAVHRDLATPRARRPGRRRCTQAAAEHGVPRPRPRRRSAAGASAATSPRSPCCAGPTCSTPPSPAPRSPSGGSTTRTTPSATSATRPSSPTSTTPARCCRWPPTSTRPLLLIHGLADDNVVAAHTLRLSSALLAAGRPHEVLPLVGVTHMTPQEVVAENLLLHQLDFLRRSLGLAPDALRCRVMEERLSELYEGVAVHATADREHMAALELLALVMLADSHLSDDELGVLRELTEDWRGTAFSFEQYLGPAMAQGPQAWADDAVDRAARRHRRPDHQPRPAPGAVLGRPRDRRRRRTTSRPRRAASSREIAVRFG